MKKLGNYLSYQLYEVEEENLEVTSSNGSRYIRNSIIVFLPKETNPKIGEEWFCGNSLYDAKAAIDKEVNLQRMPIHKQFIRAVERSKEKKDVEQEEKNIFEENERRRRECLQQSILEEKAK